MSIQTMRASLLALAVLLAGCGGDEGPNEKRFDGDAADVATVVDKLQAYARLDDGAKICEELLVESSSGNGCEERVNDRFGDADTTLTVRRVRVDGARASATVARDNGTVIRLAFVERDGEWRIGSIRGSDRPARSDRAGDLSADGRAVS
jgi:hypothetical protein